MRITKTTKLAAGKTIMTATTITISQSLKDNYLLSSEQRKTIFYKTEADSEHI